MKLKFLLILVGSVLIITQYNYGQNDNYWTKTSVPVTAGKISREAKEKKYYYHLDLKGLKNLALKAPERARTKVASDLIIAFPTSDGQTRKFSVSKASVLPPELSKKYPGIWSFAGRGVDDPTATIRFSISDYNGVWGIILACEKTTFIEPLERGDLENYMVYSDVDSSFTFECETSELGKKVESKSITPDNHSRTKATDPNLRTYRVAIISDYSYGDYFAGDGSDQQKRANILAQINSTLTQVNAVYECDLSVTLQLASNNDKILFFDGIPAPPQETVQEFLDDSIGYDNYEIGHTFMKIYDPELSGIYQGDAGCIACICTKDKGIAWSAAFLPESSVFALVVAHEMGHQMGAFHTQSSAGCISGNGQSEVEPGSGSTIMGYAGICSPNVESAPQGYFNQVSIRQIAGYIYTLSCGTFTNLGNAAPTANAGPDYIIPKSTPFVLTGQGSDPNGDQVTYTWEQNDPQVYNFNNLDDKRDIDRYYPADFKTTGPMFRSYPPSGSPFRLLPNLQTVINDGPYLFEVLPSVSRELNFVLTVRDNHPGGGRVEFDSMKVTVDGNSGPFEFSSSFAPYEWSAGASQTVTWNVAGTNAPPVSCQNVKISLSIDGGQTFPYVLNANTPNDGSENVTVPVNVSSPRCRLKIEAVNNIFYAMSKKDFSITCGGCITGIPDSLHILHLGTAYTMLAWLRGNNSDYEIRYREEGGSWTYQQSPDKSGDNITWEDIFNLSPATTYEAQVRSICDGVNTITVRARGITGQEHINVKVNDNIIGSINLTTAFQSQTFNTLQTGGITVEYDNDQGDRDVVVDYVEVNGEIRQAEDQSYNTAAYEYGECGGGSFTQWMNCNGSIGFDEVYRNNITVRARGTLGGEHINLRINGNAVASYNLTTDFKNYTATFTDNGSITVEFDNDQSNSDVVLDYIIVNGEIRQAEDQSYNTAAYDYGECGGGSFTEWMHCNGLIGFGDANILGGGASDWSDTLIFTVYSSEYAQDDINTLLRIDQFNDTQDNLDWINNPDPGTWEGVTWTAVPQKHVLKLNIGNKLLSGDMYAGGLPAMEYLSVGGNYITSLDINGSSALTTLYCSFGRLTKLDLSTQYNLTEFSGKFNLLQEINFGDIDQLVEATLLSNQLTFVNLDNMVNLELLDIQDNYLTDIDINGCSSLVRLYCKNNDITNLEVSGLSNLEGIDCEANHLTSVELSNLPTIRHLTFSFNKLTSITGLNDFTTLWNLDVNNNNFTNLNVNNLTSLIRLYANNNALTSFSGLSDLTSLTNLSVDNNALVSINGLNDLTSLEYLYISENNLTSLDLSDLASLRYVYAYFNELNSITLPSPSSLQYLDVWGNNLTELNLIGQDALETLIADDNKLKRFIISGTRVLTGNGVGVSMNNLPFTELIKVSDAAVLRMDPMNEVFDPVTSMTDVTIDYSSQAIVEGQTTTFRWYKNTQFVTSNTTGTFTTTGEGIYYCEMENGHFPDFMLTSATTTIGNPSLCDITVPDASPLPSLNTTYSHMYVVGSGPDLGNVSMFTINWSLENNGLWDISYHTSNGIPNWYVSLMGRVTQTFALSNPDMTISGSGISGLDGNYWVTMDGDDFVMAAKSGTYAIYCSNSSTQPCTVLKSVKPTDTAEDNSFVSIYPNPSSGEVSIEFEEAKQDVVVTLTDITGKTIQYSRADVPGKVVHISGLNRGIYFVNIQYDGRVCNKKLVVN